MAGNGFILPVMNLNKGCIEILFCQMRINWLVWWTLTRVVLKYIAMGSFFIVVYRWTLTRVVLKFSSALLLLLVLGMNLNKGCIEITDPYPYFSRMSKMNLNKGCIEIDWGNRWRWLQPRWTLTRVVLKFFSCIAFICSWSWWTLTRVVLKSMFCSILIYNLIDEP